MKQLFTWEWKIELTDDDNKHLNNIKSFENLSENVFGTVWLYEQWPKFITWNFEQLEKELSEYDDTETVRKYSELNKDILRELNIKTQKEVDRIIKDRINNEIHTWELANDKKSIERRTLELEGSVQKDVEKMFKTDFDKINSEYNNYHRGELDKIVSKYIKPEEWKTALETYENRYSTNKSQRIEQYIRNEIVKPQMDEILAEIDWDINTTNNKEVLNLMQREMSDKLVRDYKYLYENMNMWEDEEEKAKMKWLLSWQLESRRKLFKNQILEYSKLLSAWRKDQFFKFDDLENEAFTNAYNKLTDNEKQHLLKRDGTDTAISMLYDSNEFKKRVNQASQSFQDWEFINTTKYSILAVGNLVQEVLHWIQAGMWALFSWVTSATFKPDDESKIFYDEYELTTVNDNFINKLIKHTFYNIDDIWETIATMAIWHKWNIVSKGADKLIKWIDNLKKATRWEWMVAPIFKRNSSKWLVVWWFKTVAYWAKWLSESAIWSAVVDKNLRVADTDYNTLVNLVSDAFFEPVIRVFGKWAKAAKETETWQAVNSYSYLAVNDFTANLYKMFAWESTIADTVKELNKKWISTPEAYKRVKQASDLIFATTNVRANRAYKDNPQLLADATEKYITKLTENAKVWAYRMLTDEWNILTLKDIWYYNNEASDKIDRIFDKINSTDEFEKQLWFQELEDYKNQIKWTVNGKWFIADWRIILKKADLIEQNKIFDEKLNKVTWKVEQRNDLKQILNDLLNLRQSSANEVWKIKTKIELFDYMWIKKYTIDLDYLNELKASSPEKYNELINTWKVKIEDKPWMLWYYIQRDAKTPTLFKQLKNLNSRVFDVLIKWLTWKIDWNSLTWYSMIAPTWMTDIEFIRTLKDVFWSDIKISELTEVTWRQDIAEQLATQDSIISVKYGKPKWKDKAIFYIWVWKEIKDFWFNLRAENFREYHEEASKIS